MTPEEQSAKLQLLLDFETLQRLKSDYCELVDALIAKPDPIKLERLAQLFTPDAVLDFGTRLGRFEGHAGIKRLFGETLPKVRSWVWHSFQNPIIDIRGDYARGRWTLLAYVIKKDDLSRTPERVIGRYDDEFVRVDRGWCQKRLRFIFEPP